MNNYTAHFVALTTKNGKPVKYRYMKGKVDIGEPDVVNAVMVVRGDSEKTYLVTPDATFEWLKYDTSKVGKVLIIKEIGFDTPTPWTADFYWKPIEAKDVEEDAQKALIKALEIGKEG